MNTAELFSATESFSKVMHEHGHNTFTVEIDPSFGSDMVASVMEDEVATALWALKPRILWASPPCQGFSVAAIGKNWNRDYTPKSDSAEEAILLAKRARELAERFGTWFFIENPRGMLRKLWIMEGLTRHTITYCQYGDTRMKPTDIWTNAFWWHPKPPCKNGAKCHVAAPRGSKTGTQGIKGAKDRGRIPAALFEEILEQML